MTSNAPCPTLPLPETIILTAGKSTFAIPPQDPVCFDTDKPLLKYRFDLFP